MALDISCQGAANDAVSLCPHGLRACLKLIWQGRSSGSRIVTGEKLSEKVMHPRRPAPFSCTCQLLLLFACRAFTTTDMYLADADWLDLARFPRTLALLQRNTHQHSDVPHCCCQAAVICNMGGLVATTAPTKSLLIGHMTTFIRAVNHVLSQPIASAHSPEW